jgi:hypothetical protein
MILFNILNHCGNKLYLLLECCKVLLGVLQLMVAFETKSLSLGFSLGLRRFPGLGVEVRGKSPFARQTWRVKQGDATGLNKVLWQMILINCAVKFR